MDLLWILEASICVCVVTESGVPFISRLPAYLPARPPVPRRLGGDCGRAWYTKKEAHVCLAYVCFPSHLSLGEDPSLTESLRGCLVDVLPLALSYTELQGRVTVRLPRLDLRATRKERSRGVRGRVWNFVLSLFSYRYLCKHECDTNLSNEVHEGHRRRPSLEHGNLCFYRGEQNRHRH